MLEILEAFQLNDGAYRYVRPVVCISQHSENDFLEIHLEKINP